MSATVTLSHIPRYVSYSFGYLNEALFSKIYCTYNIWRCTIRKYKQNNSLIVCAKSNVKELRIISNPAALTITHKIKKKSPTQLSKMLTLLRSKLTPRTIPVVPLCVATSTKITFSHTPNYVLHSFSYPNDALYSNRNCMYDLWNNSLIIRAKNNVVEMRIIINPVALTTTLNRQVKQYSKLIPIRRIPEMSSSYHQLLFYHLLLKQLIGNRIYKITALQYHLILIPIINLFIPFIKAKCTTRIVEKVSYFPLCGILITAAKTYHIPIQWNCLKTIIDFYSLLITSLFYKTACIHRPKVMSEYPSISTNVEEISHRYNVTIDSEIEGEDQVNGAILSDAEFDYSGEDLVTDDTELDLTINNISEELKESFINRITNPISEPVTPLVEQYIVNSTREPNQQYSSSSPLKQIYQSAGSHTPTPNQQLNEQTPLISFNRANELYSPVSNQQTRIRIPLFNNHPENPTQAVAPDHSTTKRGRESPPLEGNPLKIRRKFAEMAPPLASIVASMNYVVDIVSADDSKPLNTDHVKVIGTSFNRALFSADEFPQLKFEDCGPERDKFRAICSSEFAKDWVIKIVPKLEGLWPGAQLKAIHTGPPPTLLRSTVNMKLPAMESIDFFTVINAQNPNIDTSNWKVFNKNKPTGSKQLWIIGVDEKSVPALRELGCRPYCGMGRVKINLPNQGFRN